MRININISATNIAYEKAQNAANSIASANFVFASTSFQHNGTGGLLGGWGGKKRKPKTASGEKQKQTGVRKRTAGTKPRKARSTKNEPLQKGPTLFD